MMQEAEAHADEDKKRKEEIETRNQADQAAYARRAVLKDTGDKLAPSDRAAIESAIEDSEEGDRENDAPAMQEARWTR